MKALSISYSNYPFGMQMPGRVNSYGAGVEYRYAYNGMERDNEVSGNGNSYTTEFRQYDPRLGRWKSLDPLMAKFPDKSPFNSFENNPILYIDPDGLEIKASRRQKRELRKRDDWKEIKKTYKGRGNDKRDLDVKEASAKQTEEHGLTTIQHSEIRPDNLEGKDNDKNEDHIYHQEMTTTRNQKSHIENAAGGYMNSMFIKIRGIGFDRNDGMFSRNMKLPNKRDDGSTKIEFQFTPAAKNGGATGVYTVNFKVFDEDGNLLMDRDVSTYLVDTRGGLGSGWSTPLPLEVVTDKVIIQATLVNAPGGISDVKNKNRYFAFGVRIKSKVTERAKGWKRRRIHKR